MPEVLIDKNFIKQRAVYLRRSRISDRKPYLEELPTNLDSTKLFLNLAIEKYLKENDRSPVGKLGDSLTSLGEVSNGH